MLVDTDKLVTWPCPGLQLAAVLAQNGSWWHLQPNSEFRRLIGVTVVGPTFDAVVDEIQQLRDQAPEIEAFCRIALWEVYSRLDRQVAIRFSLHLEPRGSFIGPLPSLKFVVRQHLAEKFGVVASQDAAPQ
jgi:hypothetical protein